MGLSCMETGDVLSALEQFVESNSNVVDVQWDRRMSPRLLVNPYAENNEEKEDSSALLFVSCLDT